jgi:hypothetical protein
MRYRIMAEPAQPPATIKLWLKIKKFSDDELSTIIVHAVGDRRRDALEWAAITEKSSNETVESLANNGLFGNMLFNTIAINGFTEALDWMQKNKFTVLGYKPDLKQLSKIAASYRNLAVIIWLVEHYKIYNSETVYSAVLNAGLSGHMPIIKWFDEKFSPGNDFYSQSGNHMFNRIAEIGQIEVMQWLWDRGVVNWIDCNSKHLLGHAAQENKLEVVKWLIPHGTPPPDTRPEMLLRIAKSTENVELQEYAESLIKNRSSNVV